MKAYGRASFSSAFERATLWGLTQCQCCGCDGTGHRLDMAWGQDEKVARTKHPGPFCKKFHQVDTKTILNNSNRTEKNILFIDSSASRRKPSSGLTRIFRFFKF